MNFERNSKNFDGEEEEMTELSVERERKRESNGRVGFEIEFKDLKWRAGY